MKTIYSVQNYRSSIFRDIVFLALGLILVVYQSGALELLIQFIGAAFVVLAVISAFKVYRTEKEKAVPFVWVGIAVGFIFGLFLFFTPGNFVKFIAILFGVMMIWGATLQLISLIKALKFTSFNFVSFFFPLLSLAIGIALVFATQEFINSSMWLIGLAMIFYAVTDCVTQYQMYKKYGQFEVQKATTAEELSSVKNTESAEEVK